MKCYSCSPSKIKPDTPVSPEPLPVSGSLREAYEALLSERGVDSIAEGLHVLHLAAMIDRSAQPGSQITGSQVAALSRELRAALADALKGVSPAADTLDELTQRRLRRAGA